MRSIFGPVIDALVTGADPDTVSAASNVIATMMGFFNSGILIVGTLIVSYVAVMGTLNTANDGEVMGRNWSSLWTPVRIVAGGAVLLPTASGFSFIQLVVLMFALWGVGFANGTYKTGMAIGVLNPDGVVQGVNDPGSFYGLRDFGKQYLAASYCARAANQIYPGAQVSAAPSADKTSTNGGRTEYLFHIKDRNATTNLGGGEPLCGTVSISQYAAQPAKDTTGTEAALEQLRVAAQNAKIQAATKLTGDLEAWVNTWPNDISGDWSNVDSATFNELVNAAETQVAAALMAALSDTTGVKSGFQSLATSLTDEGWAMSGGWYQRVGEVRGRITAITSESVGSVSAPSLSALPADAAASRLIGSVTTVTEAISKKSEAKGNYKAPTSGPGDLTSVIPKDAQSDINIGSINADFDAKVSLWINSLMESMVEMATGANTSGTNTNRRLLTLSRQDGLLGIANRRYFDEMLLVECQRHARDHAPLGVLMIDVDHFKPYNDHYGHVAGDECLKAIATVLRGAVHRPADLVARFGGEEFVLLLPDTASAGAAIVAKRIHAQLAELGVPHLSSPIGAHVTVSIGVAELRPGSTSCLQLLLAAADAALYQAKQRGRNRTEIDGL